ncbi:NAD(P)-dependent oxidoreductase [Candidatus Pelagibacter sp.]|nr:NAD(P)-dependent oxidoreductase [Candidatus Pelagibacter sp.]
MSFKSIGITGSTGVLGSYIKKNFKSVKFDCFNGDVANKKDIQKWLKDKKFDALFHFAAVVPTKKVQKNYTHAKRVNYFGTKLLIDEVKKNQTTKWFLFSSTSHVYKFTKKKITEKSLLKPISKYGFTKLMAEKYLLKKNGEVNICIIRIFSYTNFNQNVSFFIPSIYKKFLINNLINLNNINHVRDFIDITDIFSAIKLLYLKKSNGIYNLGSGKPTPLIKIVKYLSNLFKKKYIVNKLNKKTMLVSDVKKIIKLGWKPKNDIKKILKSYHLNFKRK